ncbi:MAG: TrkH family potassium uptake protein [Gammaproteobacteria bacterium]
MQYKPVLRVLGVFLMLHSLGLLPPLAISVSLQDGHWRDFFYTFLLSLGGGFLLWWSFRQAKHELRRHEGFLIVASFWLVLSAVSAIPFILGPHLNFFDAFFEATSAFTTTGATVITGLDELPKSVLFYRQELQWLGGMGIIVLAVAVLPLLGMGGMQLYRAETTGPFKEEKLTPRIAHTARSFILIYLGMTLLCALAYIIAGMSVFDAVAHSLSTVSTGGFSTYDASMGHFNSLSIELIAGFFMLMGAVNFSLHYLAIHKLHLRAYFASPETRVFLAIIASVVLLCALTLTFHQTYPDFLTSLRHATFTTISIITSSGYTTENFAAWPVSLPVLLIFISFVGGCAGSTAGGMKVIRFILLFKQGHREIIRLIHPAIVMPIKVGRRVVSDEVTKGVWSFFALYVAIFTLVMLVLMAGGADQVTAFAAVATTLNNLGPGLGEVSSNFQSVPDWQKLLLSLCMLLGRLELFTLIIFFMPAFWRR